MSPICLTPLTVHLLLLSPYYFSSINLQGKRLRDLQRDGVVMVIMVVQAISF